MKRLVDRLNDAETNFFIHVDKKSNQKEFENAFISPHYKNSNIVFVPENKRIDCFWGDRSILIAALNTMKLYLKDNNGGPFVLLSGQDYPLRSNKYIHHFFENHPKDNFIRVINLPDLTNIREHYGWDRLTNYTFDCRNPKNPRMKAKIEPFSFRVKTLVGFVRLAIYRPQLLPFALKCYMRKRHYPKGLIKTLNEFWISLNQSTAQFLIKTFNEHDNYMKYYQYVHVPDKTAFCAILCGNDEIKSTIRPMVHYIDWTHGKNGSPKTLDESDLPFIQSALAEKEYILFGRKFEADSSVLDKLDIMIQ